MNYIDRRFTLLKNVCDYMYVDFQKNAIYSSFIHERNTKHNPCTNLRHKFHFQMEHIYKRASNFILLIVPRRYFCGVLFLIYVLVLKILVLLVPYVC